MWQLWHYNDGDYITIYDITDNSKFTLIASLSGQDNGPQSKDGPALDHLDVSYWQKKIISSTGNKLLVEFRSDDFGEWDGFSAFIHFSPLPSKQCENGLDLTTKTIQSPNYPDSYNNNLVCKWLISVPHGSHIKLKFVEFDVIF